MKGHRGMGRAALLGALILWTATAGAPAARAAEPLTDADRAEIVERLAERWQETTGEDVRWSLDRGPHPHEAATLKLDSSKARTRLGWRTRLDLGRCLDWIVEWTRRYRDGDDPRTVTLEQIQRYVNSPQET